jgi:hypothetical protein
MSLLHCVRIAYESQQIPANAVPVERSIKREPPSVGSSFRIASGDRMKQTGLVEYRFRPDSFEVRYVRAPGQVDVRLDELISSGH